MNTDVYTEQHGNRRLTIYYDESPSSPREDTNLARIIGWSRDYNLSDDNQPSPRYVGEDYTALEWWRSYINVDPDETDNRVPNIDGTRVLFSAPLRLDDYGSGGVQLHVMPWTDDSWERASGVIYVPEDAWDECMGADHPKPTDAEGWIALIEGEVSTYQDYLNGNVYGYVVEESETCNLGVEHWAEVDSCWGFVGDYDGEYGALSEGRAAAGFDKQGVEA